MAKRIREVIEPADNEQLVADTLQHLAYLEFRPRLLEDFVRVQELQTKQISIRQGRPVRLTSYELPWAMKLDPLKAWLFEAGKLTEIN